MNLRLKIDALRKERVVFDKIYRDLEINYKQATLNFQIVMTEQKTVFAKRDRTLEQLQAVKDEATKLQTIFEQEWNQILQMLSKDINLEQFNLKRKEQTKKIREEREESKLDFTPIRARRMSVI